jgi:hypothetical protein
VVAVSADDVEDMAALQTKVPSIILVTDPKLGAIKAWGALWGSAENPSPVTFVVGKDGVVTWRHLLEARGDWPTYAALAAAL